MFGSSFLAIEISLTSLSVPKSPNSFSNLNYKTKRTNILLIKKEEEFTPIFFLFTICFICSLFLSGIFSATPSSSRVFILYVFPVTRLKNNLSFLIFFKVKLTIFIKLFIFTFGQYVGNVFHSNIFGSNGNFFTVPFSWSFLNNFRNNRLEKKNIF